MLRGESSGLWGLLDVVCDVVVPLDERLQIHDVSERFSALVTMQGGSMQGAQLQDASARANALGRGRSATGARAICRRRARARARTKSAFVCGRARMASVARAARWRALPAWSKACRARAGRTRAARAVRES